MTGRPAVHVVLCTYRPVLRHVRQQVASVLAQEDVDLSVTVMDDGSPPETLRALREVCDDPRVELVPGVRVGVFANFARGLVRAPRDVDAVLLADQDDVWHPRKAAALVAALRSAPDALLAHSDARVVDDDGRLLAPSMFAAEGRDVRHLDVDHLVLKNVVTGCTAALRPALLEVALPFPPLGEPAPFHHDLWLALCAASTGRVVTVPEPLVDYRQHGANVMGLEPARNRWRDPRRAVADWRSRRHVAEVALAALDAGQLPAGGPAEVLRAWAGPDGALHVLRLALRWGLRGDPQASFALLLGLVGLVGVLRDRTPLGPVLGLLRVLRLGLRLARRLSGDPDARSRLVERLAQDTAPLTGVPDVTEPWPHVGRPLPAVRSERRGRVLHVLVPALPEAGVFGGVATALRLAVELAEQGEQVQVVETDKSDRLSQARLREVLAGSLGLSGDWARNVSFAQALRPDDRLALGPDDVVLATAWWTALRAARTGAVLGRPGTPLVYLVQDDERTFYGGSDVQALAASTYDLPCTPVVNGATLADHLRRTTALAVDDALVLVPQVDVPALARLPRRDAPDGPLRVLFYGRPGVPRNLFETGLRGLAAWLAARTSDRPVEVVSAGEDHPPVDLGQGVVARSVGQLSWAQYEDQLSTSTLGLSLMLSPHPSYPPLEMAAAGLVVVTNRHEGKDLSALSPRFVSCAPTALDVARALGDAEARARALDPDEGRAYDTAVLGRPLPEVAAALRARLG